MIEKPGIVISSYEEIKKNNKKLSGSSTSYRGFMSIDQEMEREIALQWFGKTHNSQSFRGNFSYKGRLS